MFYFEKKATIAEIENEFEIALLARLLKGKIIETKIVRNMFILREGRLIKTKRKETVAKIEVEDVKFKDGKYRFKGKIIEIDERFKKGYHAENLKIGQKIKIFERLESEIFKYLKNVKKTKEIPKFIYKIEEEKICKNKEEIKNLAEWRIIDTLIISKDLVFENFDIIYNTLLGNGKVFIIDNKNVFLAIKRF